MSADLELIEQFAKLEIPDLDHYLMPIEPINDRLKLWRIEWDEYDETGRPSQTFVWLHPDGTERCRLRHVYFLVRTNDDGDDDWVDCKTELVRAYLLQTIYCWRMAEGTATAPTVRTEVKLSPAEEDIVEAIRMADGRMTNTKLMNEFSEKGKIPSVGTTKTTLAAMTRHGLLTNCKDAKGAGYGLPEWSVSHSRD